MLYNGKGIVNWYRKSIVGMVNIRIFVARNHCQNQ